MVERWSTRSTAPSSRVQHRERADDAARAAQLGGVERDQQVGAGAVGAEHGRQQRGHLRARVQRARDRCRARPAACATGPASWGTSASVSICADGVLRRVRARGRGDDVAGRRRPAAPGRSGRPCPRASSACSTALSCPTAGSASTRQVVERRRHDADRVRGWRRGRARARPPARPGRWSRGAPSPGPPAPRAAAPRSARCRRRRGPPAPRCEDVLAPRAAPAAPGRPRNASQQPARTTTRSAQDASRRSRGRDATGARRGDVPGLGRPGLVDGARLGRRRARRRSALTDDRHMSDIAPDTSRGT